jgi:hypothetical protein
LNQTTFFRREVTTSESTDIKFRVVRTLSEGISDSLSGRSLSESHLWLWACIGTTNQSEEEDENENEYEDEFRPMCEAAAGSSIILR